MRRMSIVSKEEQLEDQSRQGWKKLSSAGGRAGARRERLLPPGDAFAGTG